MDRREASKGGMKVVKQRSTSAKSKHQFDIGHISDVSDVEFAPRPTKKMLKLHFNLDTLQDTLSKINDAILNHGGLISDIQSDLRLKTADKNLGAVFERMAISVHKELGERSIKYKLDDTTFLAEETGSSESLFLKQAVDQFVDKLDIVSMAILKQEKAKKAIQSRVQRLEDCFKEFVSLTQFREEIIGFETRFQDRLTERLAEFEVKVAEQQLFVENAKLEFTTQVQNFQGECLWRIKDAEELIKTRITSVLVDSKVKDLAVKVERQISDLKKDTEKKISSEISLIPGQILEIKEKSESRYEDARQMINALEQKLPRLASREQINVNEAAN